MAPLRAFAFLAIDAPIAKLTVSGASLCGIGSMPYLLATRFLFKSRHPPTLGYETPERRLVPFSPIRKIIDAGFPEAQEARAGSKAATLRTPLFLLGPYW